MHQTANKTMDVQDYKDRNHYNNNNNNNNNNINNNNPAYPAKIRGSEYLPPERFPYSA
jgi:hypothetical protein